MFLRLLNNNARCTTIRQFGIILAIIIDAKSVHFGQIHITSVSKLYFIEETFLDHIPKFSILPHIPTLIYTYISRFLICRGREVVEICVRFPPTVELRVARYFDFPSFFRTIAASQR